MKIILWIIIGIVVILIFAWWKVKDVIYHDPPNGTEFTYDENMIYDEYDSQFSVKQFEEDL